MKSIQRHLTVTLLATILLLAVGAGAFLYLFARSRLIGEFDRALATEAQAASATVTRDSNGNLEFNSMAAQQPEFHNARHAAYFEVWKPDGSVFGRSASLGNRELPRFKAGAANSRARTLILPDGRSGRAVALQFVPQTDTEDQDAIRAKGSAAHIPPAPLLTLVLARQPHELNETLWVLGSSLLLAGLALAIGTVVVLAITVRRGLSPLHRLAAEADAIDAGSLDYRFSQGALPEELQPICAKLNSLLSRLDEAFARERRFTSDAAHELRTPIAELRAMTEVALRWPGDARPEQTCREALAIANQMESMVESLLSIARCQAGLARARVADVDLAEVVRETWASQSAASLRSDLALHQEIPASAPIRCDRAMLLPLISNLLSNAFAHAPHGGQVLCRVWCESGQAALEISNTCNTLGPDDLPHLFEPFWRKDTARSGGTHCGLGLSLVAAYAQAMGIVPQVQLTPEGVFRISVRFPMVARGIGSAPLPVESDACLS